jgi:hypothetical protein
MSEARPFDGAAVAKFGHMTMDLEVLHCGTCEELKAGVHATALGLFVVMAAYNIAAWLTRREAHLAVNAAVYTMLTAWEQHHVGQHLAELKRPQPAPALTLVADSGDLAA